MSGRDESDLLGGYHEQFFRFAGAALLAAAAALPVRAETLKNWKCTGNPDIAWDEQIVGCTKALESGHFTGRAIADYTEAIRLDPQYALAYNNRGLA